MKSAMMIMLALLPAPGRFLPVVVHGTCSPPSMVGEGSSKAFLDRAGQPFHCDTAIVTDLPNKRTLVQFVVKGGARGALVGFGGVIPFGSKHMAVDHLYLNDGRKLRADRGSCDFTIRGGRIRAAICGARIERQDIAIGAVISFHAN